MKYYNPNEGNWGEQPANHDGKNATFENMVIQAEALERLALRNFKKFLSELGVEKQHIDEFQSHHLLFLPEACKSDKMPHEFSRWVEYSPYIETPMFYFRSKGYIPPFLTQQQPEYRPEDYEDNTILPYSKDGEV